MVRGTRKVIGWLVAADIFHTDVSGDFITTPLQDLIYQRDQIESYHETKP